MTNAELAELLNAKAELAGAGALTANVIRQWVAWDVLPKADASGRTIGQSPLWSRSGPAVRRATRLTELRKAGVRRETALIVQAFIEWGHPDFERVRCALVHELHKWRAQLLHHRTTRIGNADYRQLSAVQQRAIRTQLGPLDSRFVGRQFQQSDEFYATFAELAQTGEGDPERHRELLTGALERMFPKFAQLPTGTQIAGITDLISGALGSPEEIANSGQSSIENASERELRIARVMTRRIWRIQRQTREMAGLRQLGRPAFELIEIQNSISAQTTIGPWAVMQLVQCLLLIRRGGRGPELMVNTDGLATLLEIFDQGFAIPKE